MELKSFCDLNKSDPNLKDVALSEDEWQSLEKLVQTLKPFEKYTKLLQSKTVTLSDFFGYWMSLRISLAKTSNNELSTNLLHEMNEKHDMLINNPVISAAVYLDPRYQRELRDRKESAIQFLENLHLRMKSVNSFQEAQNHDIDATEDLTNNSGNESLNGLEEYLNACSQVSFRDNTNDISSIRTMLLDFNDIQPVNISVLEYWEANKEKMPELYKLASAVIAIPPTQVTVERAFSALALTLTSRRTNLNDELLQDILLIRLNYDLISNK